MLADMPASPKVRVQLHCASHRCRIPTKFSELELAFPSALVSRGSPLLSWYQGHEFHRFLSVSSATKDVK